MRLAKIILWVALSGVLTIAQDFSGAVGHWTFDDPNDLLKATTGDDLQLVGSHTAVAGPDANDGAVRIGVGSHYTCLHGIAANGTGAMVNEYSLVFDFKIPSTGQYYTFYQTDITNTDDGEIFINVAASVGITGTGYSSTSVSANEWGRLVISVDNGTSINFYLNGTLLHTGTAQAIDGRYGIAPAADPVLLFADENAEDNEFDIARVVLYDKALSAAEAGALSGFIKPLPEGRYQGQTNNWYKGNSHSHPKNQIGVNPTAVLYHDNDFDYLILTEHRDWLSNDDVSFAPRRDSYLIVRGEEFHSNLSNGNKHTTVMNSTEQAGDVASAYDTKWEFYNAVYELIVSKGGFPMMNHPTWGGLVTVDDFSKITGFQHFELFNGAQDTDSYGIYGTGMPHIEDLWDDILTAGGKWYGVGSDDFHILNTVPEASNPFTGWTMVKTTELTVENLLEAYQVGRFYATNGVILEDLTTDLGLYKILVDTASTNYELARRDGLGYVNSGRPVTEGTPGYRIDFIGSGGNVLKTVNGLSGEYQVTSDDTYVRGRVTHLRNMPPGGAPYDTHLDQVQYISDNNITMEEYYAWGQPFFTDSRHEYGEARFGCTDPDYLEYDASNNISESAACITLGVEVRSRYFGENINLLGIYIKVGPEFGDYKIKIYTLNGRLYKVLAASSSREHTLKDLIQFKTYIVTIEGRNKSVSKTVMVH